MGDRVSGGSCFGNDGRCLVSVDVASFTLTMLATVCDHGSHIPAIGDSLNILEHALMNSGGCLVAAEKGWRFLTRGWHS